MKTFPNKKTNREDIRAIAEHSQEMFDYLIHVCNVLADPPSYDIHEREMKGFKKDLINTLHKLDSNANKIIGHIAYEDVKHEAFTATFKLDQFYDYHVGAHLWKFMKHEGQLLMS